ncbi:MAG: hypothetical protein IPJ89_02745 [Candidatus Iainarchaeum archaeon]|uniref:Uncharacterized protein n=1 Tax=Candidatus Iainarchaeum sp. TaxID=3101447 RepID=A0A7T9DKR1_9ARCH|nr:MAG: hypothetical protein IPJ89_02745 [Candidatus Diapherotrites archaeon]
MKMKKNILTIIIGGDMDRDERELLTNPEAAEQPENVLYLDSYEQLHSILSPARLDLLRYLIQNKRLRRSRSVGQVAKELNRKQEAISRDLHYLSGHRHVQLKKKNSWCMHSLNWMELIFDFKMPELVSVQTLHSQALAWNK